MTTYADTIGFITVSCYKCGVLFGMTQKLQKQRLTDRKLFFCPNGHDQHYFGPSEESKLKDELARKESMLEAERARASTLQTERDAVSRAHSRMRSRVMNGVCPCCNRTFQNLLRHMQTEHAGELNLKTLRQAFGMTQGQVAKEIGVYPAIVSLHERGKPVPHYARQSIERWINMQEPSAVTQKDPSHDH